MSETTQSDNEVFWTDDAGREHCDVEKALSLMLADDGDLFVLPDYKGTGRIVISVNCNDLFCWGCSDAEEVPYNQIDKLYRAWKKEGWRGASKWACKRRRERPQGPIEKRWRDAGDWDDELEALPAK